MVKRLDKPVIIHDFNTCKEVEGDVCGLMI